MDFSLSPKYQTKINSKKTYIFLGSVLLVLVLFTIYGSQDAEITLNSDSFVINGMYGFETNYKDIYQIDTLSVLPYIEQKTNGYSFMSICKGHFNLRGVGNAKLFLNYSHPPFVHVILRTGDILYLNFKDIHKTIDLYDNLKMKTIKK